MRGSKEPKDRFDHPRNGSKCTTLYILQKTKSQRPGPLQVRRPALPSRLWAEWGTPGPLYSLSGRGAPFWNEGMIYRMQEWGRHSGERGGKIRKSCFLVQIKAHLYPAAVLLFSLPPPCLLHQFAALDAP